MRLKEGRGFALLTLLLLAGGSDHAAVNLIQTENAKPGATDWQLTNPGHASGAIEGYASLTSVNRGGQIKFFVNTTAPSYTIDIFRLGYYGGLGGRRMMATISRPGTVQPIPTPDPTTGLIECNWTNPSVLTIPNTSDPTNWMSGMYLAKLTASDSGVQNYIVFAVRDDTRASDLLLAQTVDTYQAYNVWGGKSLYGTIANRGDTANDAHKVSFNRPYYGDDTSGAGNLPFWEQPMLAWLEAEGYDVSYATNIDVDRDPTLLLNHKAFLSVGHDEYWSWRMRDNVEAARDQGVNLGFFSGNTSYWQVRFESSLLTGDPYRTLVGYKEAWAQDPITPDYLKTDEFRYAPVNRPEDQMIGEMYITQGHPTLVIEDASHWVLTGTGLNNSDHLNNPDGTPFLGYEVDGMNSGSPANTQRIGHSPVEPDAENYSDMTIYRALSGATVFATGSIAWSTTIPQVQQITRNVLSRFVTGAFADTAPVRPALPSPWAAQDIGAVGRPGFVGAVGQQSLTLNGAGQGIYGDTFYYVYQPLNGDGTITTRLTGLQLYWDNRAGVMIRESLSPGSKFVSLVGRPSGSRGSLLEGEELYSRSATGGAITRLNQNDMPLPNWLKLTRTGDVFNASVSADGSTWTPLGTATVPMNSNVFIGFNVVSARQGVWVTANLDNVNVSGGSGGDGVLDRSDWTAWASESSPTDPPSNAIDGNIATRFSTGQAQHDSQGFRVSWPGNRTVSRIRMDLGPNPGDYPRLCGIWPADATGASTAIPCNPDAAGNVDISFAPLQVQKIEVWQWGVAGNWWSIAEFNAYAVGQNSGRAGALDRSDWTAWASENSPSDPPSNAIDGNLATRFSTGDSQHNSQGFRVSWPGNRTIGRIRIDLGNNPGDYPHTCGIWPADATGHSTFIPCSPDSSGNIDVTFTPLQAQRIEVWQWGVAGNWWSIAEFNAYPSGTGSQVASSGGRPAAQLLPLPGRSE
jgi:hypothetical protein